MSRRLPLVLFSMACGWGNWNDTSTGIDLDKLAHPTLTRVRAGVLKPGERAQFDGIEATIVGQHAVLRGRGKSGRTWTVKLCDFCFEEVWRIDLDGNGTPDYVIFGTGPFWNGRTTPPFSLSFLMMDSEGMPVPFFTVLHKGDNGDGIKHLISVGGKAPATNQQLRRDRLGPSRWRLRLRPLGHPDLPFHQYERRGAPGNVRWHFIPFRS